MKLKVFSTAILSVAVAKRTWVGNDTRTSVQCAEIKGIDRHPTTADCLRSCTNLCGPYVSVGYPPCLSSLPSGCWVPIVTSKEIEVQELCSNAAGEVLQILVAAKQELDWRWTNDSTMISATLSITDEGFKSLYCDGNREWHYSNLSAGPAVPQRCAAQMREPDSQRSVKASWDGVNGTFKMSLEKAFLSQHPIVGYEDFAVTLGSSKLSKNCVITTRASAANVSLYVVESMGFDT